MSIYARHNSSLYLSQLKRHKIVSATLLTHAWFLYSTVVRVNWWSASFIRSSGSSGFIRSDKTTQFCKPPIARLHHLNFKLFGKSVNHLRNSESLRSLQVEKNHFKSSLPPLIMYPRSEHPTSCGAPTLCHFLRTIFEGEKLNFLCRVSVFIFCSRMGHLMNSNSQAVPTSDVIKYESSPMPFRIMVDATRGSKMCQSTTPFLPSICDGNGQIKPWN